MIFAMIGSISYSLPFLLIRNDVRWFASIARVISNSLPFMLRIHTYNIYVLHGCISICHLKRYVLNQCKSICLESKRFVSIRIWVDTFWIDATLIFNMRKLMKFQPFDSLPCISLLGLPNAKDLGASTTFAREKDVEKILNSSGGVLMMPHQYGNAHSGVLSPHHSVAFVQHVFFGSCLSISSNGLSTCFLVNYKMGPPNDYKWIYP